MLEATVWGALLTAWISYWVWSYISEEVSCYAEPEIVTYTIVALVTLPFIFIMYKAIKAVK